MAPRTLSQLLRSTVAVALLAPSAAGSASAQTPSVRTVLAVQWSSESFPGTHELDAIIQEVLRSRVERLDYFAEYLESDRFSDEDASVALRDYIQRKYRDRRIDIVIAVTDVALRFVLRHRAELFPDAPIVSSTISEPDASVRSSGPGVAGLVYSNGFGETLRLALKLHPSTTRVFYVAQASDPTFRESMHAQLRGVDEHVELTGINEASLPHLIAAVKAVPAGSVILYIRYTQDDAGNVLYPAEVAPAVVDAATVPVYGVAQAYLGTGVVGVVAASRRVIGTRIAEIASEILHGTRPQDMSIEHPALVPMFDWRQLRRWGIGEELLAADSVVLFREISIFQQYRTAILVTLGVLLLQSSLIAGLLFERRRRRRAEMDSRRNLAALAHMDRRAAMGELATSLAHELNQPLNAILQNAGVAQMLLSTHPLPPALGDIADIISDIHKDDIRASEMIRRMRGLLQKHELESHPVDLNEVAQETIAVVRPDAMARQIELETDLAATVRPILGDRVHLQQVLLNLVMNAMDAVGTMPPERRRVRVQTTTGDGEVRLAVTDTGVGVPPDRIAAIFEPFYTTKGEGRGMGMGLAIARSIIDAHAGRIAAENNDGGGTTVWFTVPMPRAAVAVNAEGQLPVPTTTPRPS